jgi:hypothetical protein
MSPALGRNRVAVNISVNRQRIPMIDASILNERTQPAPEGSMAARLRYFQWRGWTGQTGRVPSHRVMPTQARLGRR